jgi:hypothetical protein
VRILATRSCSRPTLPPVLIFPQNTRSLAC